MRRVFSGSATSSSSLSWRVPPAAVALMPGRTFFGPFKKDSGDNNAAGSKKEEGNPSLSAAFGSGFKSFSNPLGALNDAQAALDKMKSAGGKPPAFMIPIIEKNLASAESSLQKMNQSGADKKSERYRAAELNVKLMKEFLSVAKGIPISEVGKKTTTATGSTTTTSVSTSTEGAGGLSAEMEELFAELKSMREKKNDMKRQLADKTTAFEKQNQEYSSLQKTERDLRDRLKQAENNVSLLNSEVLDLKEKAKEAKTLRTTTQQLERKVAELRGQDTAPLQTAIEKLEHKLQDKEDAVRSLQRKLDRSRKHSPLNAFSLAISDISRAAGDEFDHETVDIEFQALQDRYFSRVKTMWQDESMGDELGAPQVLLEACKSFLYAIVPCARLDALVIPTNASSWLEAMQKEDSQLASDFIVEAAPTYLFEGEAGGEGTEGAQGYIVRCRTDNPRVHPYALMFSHFHAATADTEAGARSPWWGLKKVAPYISGELTKSETRADLKMETCRSSGPGGQAVNVAETQVFLKLFIDNVLTLQSHASDTRSAQDNKKLANERLYLDALEHWNKKAKLNCFTPMDLKSLKKCAVSRGGVGGGKKSGGADDLEFLCSHHQGSQTSSSSSGELAEEEIVQLANAVSIEDEKWKTVLLPSSSLDDGNVDKLSEEMIPLINVVRKTTVQNL